MRLALTRVALAAAVLVGCGGGGPGSDASPDATTTRSPTGVQTQDPDGTETPVTLATETLEGDDELLAAIVQRADELGAEVDADDLRLTALPADTVPGMRVFRAIYTYRDMRDAVTGVVGDDGEIVAYPLDALERVFATWLDGAGLPDAAVVADVVAFVIGGAGPNEVVHTTEDAARIGGGAGAVSPPRPHDDLPGVVFWWDSRGNGVEEVAAYLDDGFLEIERRPLAEAAG